MKFNRLPVGQLVCEVVEDYHQPESLRVWRQNDGFYTVILTKRNGQQTVSKTNLIKAYSRAKRYAQLNGIPSFQWHAGNYPEGSFSF